MEVLLIVVVTVVLAAAAAEALLVWRRQRSARLQHSFGPEYDRTVEETGRTGAAESELAHRQKRRSQFQIVALSAASATLYRDEWNQTQLLFVDEPERAVQDADALVVRIMRERGYPVDDFDTRADDLSVDHPDVVQHYRDAHGIAVAQSQGQADTEQLRQAVTSSRALVDALLDEHRPPHPSGSQDMQEER